MHTLVLLAAAFALEWNPTYRADVPYEVEVSPAKLGAEKFVVYADGKPLETEIFTGKSPGTLDLRFRVPAGTKSLTCKGAGGKAAVDVCSTEENLFAGALGAANLAKWRLPKGVSVTQDGDGLLFVADASFKGGYATYETDIPADVAGKPVWQEIDVVNRATLVWGGHIHIVQLDANGKPLPELLCDGRWTTHMRPPEKSCPYRDEGHADPRARRLRFKMELRTVHSDFDDYGLPIADHSILLPKIRLGRLAVRVAERLPFPKWNDSYFAPGVSGKEGDTALAMGGDDRVSLFYQTRSRAAWTQSHQFRKEEELLFPSGAATVEVFLKPDWKAHRTAKSPAVTLFETFQSYVAAECKRGKGVMMNLSYIPETEAVSLLLRDYTGALYTNVFAGVAIPDGRWSHVALQWTPGKTADVFIGGRKVATMAIPEFKALPLNDKSISNINDAWAQEFFLGASCQTARLSKELEHAERESYFQGSADLLRVSTGCRYAASFKPATSFEIDGATRALFRFDRAFDGVAGGGFGFIPASIRADRDRVEHVLAFEDGRKIQYYPAKVLPENDPMVVLDHDNYPVLPSDAEYREARVSKRLANELKPGEKWTVRAAERAYPDYVEFENLSATEPVRYPILVAKGALDPRSYGDLCDSLTIDGSGDRDRVNRLFQFVMHASDYFMCHQADFRSGSDKPVSACYDALMMLNSYCGFECGPLNNMTANMLSTVAKCPACQTGGYGHEFEQVFFDGKNHIYDLSARKFFPSMDNETSVYLKEWGDQPGLGRRFGASCDHFIRCGTRGTWALDISYQEKCAVTLNPGEKIRICYANDAQMNNVNTRGRRGPYGWAKLPLGMHDYARLCGADERESWTVRRDRVFPHISTAFLTFDGVPTRENPAFCDVKGDSFVYRVRSPYPVVFTEFAAYLASGRLAELEVSTDGGKTFAALARGEDGVAAHEYRLKARRVFLIRVKAPIASVRRFLACTTAEVNPRTYPGWVKGGLNEFTYKAESGGAARVTVAWREPSKEIVISGTAKQGAIPGFERELALVDPAQPLTLDVAGVSPAARVRTYGRITARLASGKLTLAYAADRPDAIKHGLDMPKGRKPHPAFAGVDIVDGDAVKTLTAIVAPNARMLLGDAGDFNCGKEFAFHELPAGKYQVFCLARGASRPAAGCISFKDPATGKRHAMWRSINECYDYRGMVFFGREGRRSRWKWDSVPRHDLQHSASGWFITTFDFPAFSKLEVFQPWVCSTGIELGAVLILPDPDEESQLELRKMLFGLNCDPFHVRWDGDKTNARNKRE